MTSLIAFLLYLIVGAVIGLFAGLFGVGGGVLTVPALVIIFNKLELPRHMIMQLAAGTSLAAMVVTSLSASWGYYKQHLIQWPITVRLSVGLIIGTIIGAKCASLVPSEWLEVFMVVVLFSFAVRILMIPDERVKHHRLPRAWGFTIYGLGIGVISGLLGIGGGSMIVPLLMFYGIAMRRANAVAASSTVAVAVVGAASYIYFGWVHQVVLPKGCLGFVYVSAFVGIAITSVIFAQIGVKLNRKLSVPVLKRVFAIFLMLVGIKMLFNVI